MDNKSLKKNILFTLGTIFFSVIFILLYSIPQGIAMMTAGKHGILASIVAVGGALAIIGAYIGVVRLLEKHLPKDLNIKRLLPEMGKGLLIGILMMGLTTVVLWAIGSYGLHDDITSVNSENLGIFLFNIPFFLLVAVGEEVIFRGMIFRIIDERISTLAAYNVSALLFGFMHFGVPGAGVWSSTAIAIEAGLLLAVAYKFSGSLWMPIGIHWSWNLFEGPIFGYQVSGNDFGTSLLHSYVSGPDIITGGSFGPEASIIMVVIGIGFIFWLWKKNPDKCL